MQKTLSVIFTMLLWCTAAPAQQPDIYDVMFDDMTVADLQVMPNVLSLVVGRGTEFKNAYVEYALCCNSRAVRLTGQHTHNHEIWGNNFNMNGGYDKFRALGESETLPVWLQRAGYKTRFIGKKLMNGFGAAPNVTHVPPGWNTFFAGLHVGTSSVYDYTMNNNGTLVYYDCNSGNHETDVLRTKAAAYIRNATAAPEYIAVWPLAPHTGDFGNCLAYAPYLGAKPPERFRDTFNPDLIALPHSFNEANVADKPAWIQALPLMTETEQRQARLRIAHHWDALQAGDVLVGKLIEEAEAKGRNYCISVSSDNGYLTGEHRVRAGKMLPYEQSVRVPLAVYCNNGAMPQGNVRQELVLNTDLVATFVALAGATAGRTLDGKSLVPLLSTTAAVPWREAFLFHGNVPADWADDDSDANSILRYKGVITKTAKYILYANGLLEFYYLTNDPNEMMNRGNEPTVFPALKAQMSAALLLLDDCVGEGCWMEQMP